MNLLNVKISDSLILDPVTGKNVGKLKKTTSMTANRTTVKLQSQPSQFGTAKARGLGSTLSSRLRSIRRKAGMANEIICRMMLLLIRALNAVVEAR